MLVEVSQIGMNLVRDHQCAAFIADISFWVFFCPASAGLLGLLKINSLHPYPGGNG